MGFTMGRTLKPTISMVFFFSLSEVILKIQKINIAEFLLNSGMLKFITGKKPF
jgi:hypothetical protein